MKKKAKKYSGEWDKYPISKSKETNYLLPETQYSHAPENIPEHMLLDIDSTSGAFFGFTNEYEYYKYVGMKQGAEGNILVVGGNGSGKSSGIAKPTLKTWQGAMCVTDIKGELSDHYRMLCHEGLVKRQYIIFNPLQANGLGYDPFYELEQVDERDLVASTWEIVLALCPTQHDDPQPFWAKTQQGILAASLLHYFRLGLSFSETISMITSLPTSELIKKILENKREDEKMLLGELLTMKPETLANFDRGLRNDLMLFAVDPYIAHAFRGRHEGAECFTWDDLDKYNIFLCVPEDRIEQWGSAINLMYTQLIRHLERRSDKYSPEGINNMQTLLLMDEVARFGKLNMLTNAMSTLRSKNVNICLMIQSIAQLDYIYGEYGRRIILDNCQYQVILRANDPETQKYFCDLIGTKKGIQRSLGETMSKSMKNVCYSMQMSEIREWKIQPHELSTLKDALLICTDGFFCLEKAQCQVNAYKDMHIPTPRVINAIATTIAETIECPEERTIIRKAEIIECPEERTISKKGENKMLTAEERILSAIKHATVLEHQDKVNRRNEEAAQKKKTNLRNLYIGELVTKYFPELQNIDPGTKDENMVRFKQLETVLSVLSEERQLIETLKRKAANICSADNETGYQLPSNHFECVSGQVKTNKAVDTVGAR